MEKPPPSGWEEHHPQSQQQHQGYEPIPTAPPPYLPPQQQAGYPPQNQYEGGYQNQGYPPQNPGYPPQRQGYIQQPTGYPLLGTHTNVVVQGNLPQLPAGVNPVVNDRLCLAVVGLICCLPIGIFAVNKSLEARNRYMAGDYAGAVASARRARNLALAALGTTLVICLLGIVIVTVLATTTD